MEKIDQGEAVCVCFCNRLVMSTHTDTISTHWQLSGNCCYCSRFACSPVDTLCSLLLVTIWVVDTLSYTHTLMSESPARLKNWPPRRRERWCWPEYFLPLLLPTRTSWRKHWCFLQIFSIGRIRVWVPVVAVVSLRNCTSYWATSIPLDAVEVVAPSRVCTRSLAFHFSSTVLLCLLLLQSKLRALSLTGEQSVAASLPSSSEESSSVRVAFPYDLLAQIANAETT